MPVTVYRSSDAGAPVLIGGGGSLLGVLDACLVDGYGGTFATGTIVCDGTLVSDGDTITIGSQTYTFRTSLTAQPAYTISLNGLTTQAQLMTRVMLTLNAQGVVATDYPAGTYAHPDVWAAYPGSGSTVTLQARKAGSGGNVALSEAALHLTVSGSTLTGGGGSITKAGAGWTKVAAINSRAGYRQGGGNQFYLFVDDSSPHASALSKEAQCRGYETLTDSTPSGTGIFPTVAQIPQGCVVRKSASLDGAARQWIVVADNRTVYVFVDTGDGGHAWYAFTFGDIYSTMGPTDGFRTFICGRGAQNDGTTQYENVFGVIGIASALSNHFMARLWTGTGGSTNVGKHTDWFKAVNVGGAGTPYPVGYTPLSIYPNPEDGGLYLAPIWIHDYNGTAWSFRGRMRGVWAPCHPTVNFADLDTFSGTAGTEFAGKTFMVFKPIWTFSQSGYVVIETSDTWETN